MRGPLFASVVRIAVPGDTERYSNLPAESPMSWQTEICEAKFTFDFCRCDWNLLGNIVREDDSAK